MMQALVIQAMTCCWTPLALCLLAATPIPRLPVVTQLHGGSASLRDVPGLAVVAEATSPEARFLGITEEWLTERVTARLRGAGVHVLERSDALSSARQPLAVVRLQTMRVPDRLAIAWHLSLEVYQKVATLGVPPDSVLADTWAASATIGVTSEGALRGSVGKSLGNQVDELLRAWSHRAPEE